MSLEVVLWSGLCLLRFARGQTGDRALEGWAPRRERATGQVQWMVAACWRRGSDRGWEGWISVEGLTEQGTVVH